MLVAGPGTRPSVAPPASCRTMARELWCGAGALPRREHTAVATHHPLDALVLWAAAAETCVDAAKGTPSVTFTQAWFAADQDGDGGEMPVTPSGSVRPYPRCLRTGRP